MGIRRAIKIAGMPAAVILSLCLAVPTGAADRVVTGTRVVVEQEGDNVVHHRCLSSLLGLPANEPLNAASARTSRFALPVSALAPQFDTTISCLVLRFNFQYEETDDPNTTGRGRMNILTPLANPVDSQAYLDSVGHWVDPPPHDSAYFHAHLRALDIYYQFVSEFRVNLQWETFPYGDTTTYELPHQMSTYGACSNLGSDIIAGLEQYFNDCIELADTAHRIDPLKYPDIDWSQYDAVFLFHAGSDRQNDIGFPTTCSDLFTGFIKIGIPVKVDNGTFEVGTALMMPETSSQDNRAVALNAVMAHEFGHQLGLVDLYSTQNFMSQLGDFALMDNNGFATGVDLGFPAGTVFGALPLMPMAWSRAFLGFNAVEDFREGTDIRLVSAALQSSGLKIARMPISEKEYFLAEVRQADFRPNPAPTFEQPIRLDSTSNVFLGPVEVTDTGLAFTGEYDALIPGDGMAIYRIDEGVAALPAFGGGASPQFPDDVQNRFEANQLQWDPDRRFVTLMEADGLVNFGGFYRAGFGDPEDLFRDDRANSFTPHTNPPAVDNSGNNSRVFVTNIGRDFITDPFGQRVYLDSVMFMDVETDKRATGFPVRCTFPRFPHNPIAADIDRDGTAEIIAVSANKLFAFTTTGENFLHKVTACAPCTTFYDTVGATVNAGIAYPVPLYQDFQSDIFSGPVVGDFGDANADLLVVVGDSLQPTLGRVYFFAPTDDDGDGYADELWNRPTVGIPVALSFGARLYVLTLNVLTSQGAVYRMTEFMGTFDPPVPLPTSDTLLHGIARLGDSLVVMAGDDISSRLHVIVDDAVTPFSYDMGAVYQYGPIVVDVDRDGTDDVAAFSDSGRAILVSVDFSGVEPAFSTLARAETDFEFLTNPVAADVNTDGYPDVLVGGRNAVYAFNKDLFLLTGYPLEVNDRFPDDELVATPVVAGIASGNPPEIIFPTLVGNVYSLGPEPTFGFPVSGGELGSGSPVVYKDSTGGYVGYLGADGWFYSWETGYDDNLAFWPMGGANAAATFAFNPSRLIAPGSLTQEFDEERFYNYPNPVLDGETTFRYYLGEAPDRVTLTVYTLSGEQVAAMEGTRNPASDNEVRWPCGEVTPGVYRCIIEVDYAGDTRKTFTDVAIIR
jgi:M6 family metalloprotease-like protein